MTEPTDMLADQILADARKQCGPIRRRAERERESTLRRARQDAERKRDQIVRRAEQKAEVESHRMHARTELEVENIKRQAQEQILLQARRQATEGLREQTRRGHYAEQLVRLALAAVRAMKGARFELVLREEDKAHAEKIIEALRQRTSGDLGRQVEVAVAQETVRAGGGLIVRSADGRQVCDQTFEARLRRLWEELREEIAGNLLTGMM